MRTLNAPAQLGSSSHKANSKPIAARRPQRASCVATSAVSSSDNGASTSGSGQKPFINVIPQSAWENGIPPVMGAHLMASGTVAPISTSKGAGMDVHPPPVEYPGAANTSVVVYATRKQVAAGMVKVLTASAAAAIKAKGSWTMVLSGGSLPDTLAGLADAKIDWSKVYVFWADERNVPHNSEDSNLRLAQEAFLSKVPIPAANVYAIAENLGVEQAATNYEGRLLSVPESVLPRNAAGWPVFDAMLLGVGPDGHVASLFPNRASLREEKKWVIPIDNSPKPPPERITMTLPVINAAKEVYVVALGDSKAEIVQRVLEVQSLPGALPAQLVRVGDGQKLVWVLDAAAAQELDISAWEEGSKAFPRSK